LAFVSAAELVSGPLLGASRPRVNLLDRSFCAPRLFITSMMASSPIRRSGSRRSRFHLMRWSGPAASEGYGTKESLAVLPPTMKAAFLRPGTSHAAGILKAVLRILYPDRHDFGQDAADLQAVRRILVRVHRSALSRHCYWL